MCPLGRLRKWAGKLTVLSRAHEIDMRSPDLNLALGSGDSVDSDLTLSLGFTSWDLVASL